MNILKELHDDLGIDPPDHGCLDAWAAPGRAAPQRHAHRARPPGRLAPGQGLGDLHRRGHPRRQRQARAGRVHPLGRVGPQEAGLVDTSRHVVIESAHPSPLSAHNGFFGSRPFSRANAALDEAGRDPVDWRLATALGSRPCEQSC